MRTTNLQTTYLRQKFTTHCVMNLSRVFSTGNILTRHGLDARHGPNRRIIYTLCSRRRCHRRLRICVITQQRAFPLFRQGPKEVFDLLPLVARYLLQIALSQNLGALGRGQPWEESAVRIAGFALTILKFLMILLFLLMLVLLLVVLRAIGGTSSSTIGTRTSNTGKRSSPYACACTCACISPHTHTHTQTFTVARVLELALRRR
jgi:hypothetical protein